MPKCRKGKISENRVGKRYKKAGYHVQYRRKFRFGEIDILARRGKEKIAAEVKHGNRRRVVSSSAVKKIAKKARRLKAKPTLILTGKAEISSKAKKVAKELGVRIRRI